MYKLTLIVAALLIHSKAIASKARLISLGESKLGSHFIDDDRNIFLNPAEINNYTDFIILELGKDPVNTSSYKSATEDSDTVSRAEGGYIQHTVNLIYGLYLGAENDQVNRYRYRVSDELPGEDNKMDLFVGGNAGVLWGVSFGMSMTEDEINNNSSSTSLVSRFGIKTQRYDLYGMIEISNNAESKVNNTKIEYEGDLGFQLGYIQKYAEYSIFGNIKHLDFQFKNGTDVTDVDSTYDFIDNGKFNQDELQIGFGKAKIVNEKAKIFTRLTVDYLKSKKDLDSGTDISITEYSIPVSFAIEYEASNWLVFRGSISQSLFSKYKQGSLEYTKRNSTNVNAGLSFIWGTFQLDGLIGTSSNGSTVDTENETGTLATDQLMSKASIKYRF